MLPAPVPATSPPPPRRAVLRTTAAGFALLALTACTPDAGAQSAAGGLRATSTPAAAHALVPAVPAPAPRSAGASDGARRVTDARVRPLEGLRPPDVLVVGALPATARTRLAALAAPGGSVTFSTGTVRLADQPLEAVAVDASAFRAFTAPATAQADAVWRAVARGEAVASHEAADARGLVPGEHLTVEGPGAGGSPGATLRLGALATAGLPRTDLVVSRDVGRRLGLPADTGMLLTAADGQDPAVLARDVRGILGAGAAVDLLSAPAGDPVASLTGGAAAQELGAFTYRYYADGTIEPDARWVQANIRTQTVPVLGRVTCHRLMLPQLRGALQEVADAGLADTIRTYDGCYVPRFIERNPNRSISLHTWGIAIDVDASTNGRGVRGTMHPQVVEIFKRWGFRWGGDWTYTDPMHFELGTLVDVPGD